MSEEDLLLTDEFVVFCSPRYFRLIFPSLKPTTKNGDLISALNELRRSKILTYDSSWDRIKLTKKGNTYKKLIKKLMDIEIIKNPQDYAILDYRSESGRKVILELIRFLAHKLDFNEYFRYLNVPVFESEENIEWIDKFENLDEESTEEFDNFLKKLNKKDKSAQRTSKSFNKKYTKEEANPIKLNLRNVKKFLKNAGMNRPGPLFTHFNNDEKKVFYIEDKFFHVNIAELMKIYEILEENLIDFKSDNNKWLTDYFNSMKLPTKLIGFQKSEFGFVSKEKNAFLNVAIEGPKIFASQFSATIDDLGELKLIIFPISPTESIVIKADTDIILYFTIPTKNCEFQIKTNMISNGEFPEVFRSSRKRFGKLFSWGKTLKASSYDHEKAISEEKEDRKNISEERREMESKLKDTLNQLSNYSVSLFMICYLIAKKITVNFLIAKCMCIFENGCVSEILLTSDTILTTIQKGKIEFGQEFNNVLKEIENTLDDVINID